MPFRTRDSVLSCYHVLLGDFLQVPRISNNHCSCIESTYGVRWVVFFQFKISMMLEYLVFLIVSLYFLFGVHWHVLQSPNLFLQVVETPSTRWRAQ